MSLRCTLHTIRCYEGRRRDKPFFSLLYVVSVRACGVAEESIVTSASRGGVGGSGS